MFSLPNRVALVTGAGRGIGRAIAVAFARAGATVAVTARTQAELDEVLGQIQACRAEGLALSADLADPAVPMQVAADVVKKFGRVDILVNNAGIGSSADARPVLEYSDEFWELSLRLNLTAPYKLSKAVLPGMMKRRWGRIIQIASINSKIPSFHGAAYTASKHGLWGFSKVLALEVARDGVTVNCICPGPVHTLMNDKRLEYDARRRGITFAEVEQAMTPIGGRLEPEDIAPMAVYLASDAARMITGQGFNVDGGVLMAT